VEHLHEVTPRHAIRRAVLLLILPTPPPARVQGHGVLSVEDAVQLGLERLSTRHGRQVPAPDPTQMVAWTTWADIGASKWPPQLGIRQSG
jgi:hypothetical protein